MTTETSTDQTLAPVVGGIDDVPAVTALPGRPGVPFGRTLRAELRKMVDTRAGRWMVLVMAAIAARFNFAAVSREGRAFWLLRAAPVDPATVLRAKAVLCPGLRITLVEPDGTECTWQYEDGLRRTGLGNDAPGGANFNGASKVVHPAMAEACVDFAARAVKELFPPDGPVRTNILGEVNDEKQEVAERKAKTEADNAAKLKKKRWALVYPNYEYGQAATAAFKKLMTAKQPGVEFVAEQATPLGKIDAGAVAQALADAKPDAIFSSLFGPDLAKFVREGQQRGLFKGVEVFNLLGGEPEYLDPLKDEAPVGWYVTGYPWYDIKTPEHKKFLDAYYYTDATALRLGAKYALPMGRVSPVGILSLFSSHCVRCAEEPWVKLSGTT